MAIFKLTYKGDNEVTFASGRTPLWDAQDYGDSIPNSPSKTQKVDFAWAYFAAKAAGKLGELGVPSGASVEDAIRHIADSYDFEVDRADAPLASGRGK